MASRTDVLPSWWVFPEKIRPCVWKEYGYRNSLVTSVLRSGKGVYLGALEGCVENIFAERGCRRERLG